MSPGPRDGQRAAKAQYTSTRSSTPAHFGAQDNLLLAHAVADGKIGGAKRALHHGFHHHVAGVFGLIQLRVRVHQARQQLLVERTPVDADAHGLVILDGNFDHGAKVVVILLADGDVAGIDAVFGQRPRARGILLQQQVPVVVEVSDDGNAGAEAVQPLNDVRYGSRGRIVVNRDANQLGAGAGQGETLANGAVNVGSVSIGHGLHHNWCIAADAHSAYNRGISLPALNLGHTEV